MSIVTKYVIFAVFSIIVNIATQHAVIFCGGRYAPVLIFSVVAGTAVGLVTKYFLDKKYIFNFVALSKLHEGRMFFKYTIFGGFTTLIFWGSEWAFQVAFGSDVMRYVGAICGLSVGYWLKYRLDKKFVFQAEK